MKLFLFICFIHFCFCFIQQEPIVLKKTKPIQRNGDLVANANLSPAPYPKWAHYHWVWYPSRVESQEKDLQLVKDYLAYNIRVGAINVDSRW